MNHTPGPWTAWKEEEYHAIGSSNGRALALVYLCDYPEEQGEKQAQANARLIAAAPELLEALQDLLRQVERDCLNTRHGVRTGRAREAITKATKQEDTKP
jgi:pimeloyl-ACP methyl ester carboxylesterase